MNSQNHASFASVKVSRKTFQVLSENETISSTAMKTDDKLATKTVPHVSKCQQEYDSFRIQETEHTWVELKYFNYDILTYTVLGNIVLNS